MSAGFTPGPWRAKSPVTVTAMRAHTRYDGLVQEWESDVAKVGSVAAENGGEATRWANSQLIAAAPDLVTALEDALALIRGDISGPSQRDGIVREIETALRKAGRA